MSYVITDSQNYTDIANAIRGKNGSTDTYTPAQMATAITNIPSSTVPTVSSDNYSYIFYDGTNWPLKDCYDFTTKSIIFVQSMFENFQLIDVDTIDMSSWNFRTDSPVYCNEMFKACWKQVNKGNISVHCPYKIILPTLQKVYTTSMFHGAVLHKDLDFSKLGVIDATNMFYGANSTADGTDSVLDSDTTMRHLILSNLNISNIEQISGMFWNYGHSFTDGKSLKIKFDVDLSNITNKSFQNVFRSAKKVTTIWFGNDNNTWTNTTGTYLFNGCTSLKHLVIRGTNVLNVTNANSFTNSGISTGTCTIYVPDSLVEDYKAANYWSTYASQIKPISEYVEEDD